MYKEATHSLVQTFDTAFKKPRSKTTDPVQKTPDQLHRVTSTEQQRKVIAAALALVQERVIDNPRFASNLTELRLPFPLTYLHQMRAAAIGAYIALDAGYSENVVHLATDATGNHDNGKVDDRNVRWDEYVWTAEEKISNEAAVHRHPHNSARRIRLIDPAIELPVLLHHAFQEKPYPDLAEYLPRLDLDQFTAARLVALADQTEAAITRSRAVGEPKTVEEVFKALQLHSYKNLSEHPENPLRAFSDKEIESAITAYCLIDELGFQKAA